jgi:hypothetical protein
LVLQDLETLEALDAPVSTKPTADQPKAGPSMPTPIAKKTRKKPISSLPTAPTPISGEAAAAASTSALGKVMHASTKQKSKGKDKVDQPGGPTSIALVEPITSDNDDALPSAKKQKVNSEEV